MSNRFSLNYFDVSFQHIVHDISYMLDIELVKAIFEPRHEKTCYLHMRKQRCRSASPELRY